MDIEYKGICSTQRVYVCSGVEGLLLAWHACQDLGIISKSYPEPILELRKVKSVAMCPTAAREELIKKFENVFDTGQVLKPMIGDPMKIHVKPEVVPYALSVPRTIPFARREAVRAELESMVDKEIIRKVQEPTDWVHPMVVVGKPDGSCRICVDFTALNKYVKRPVHPFPSSYEAVCAIPSGSRYFATLDATKGYWHCLLYTSPSPRDKRQSRMPSSA